MSDAITPSSISSRAREAGLKRWDGAKGLTHFAATTASAALACDVNLAQDAWRQLRTGEVKNATIVTAPETEDAIETVQYTATDTLDKTKEAVRDVQGLAKETQQTIRKTLTDTATSAQRAMRALTVLLYLQIITLIVRQITSSMNAVNSFRREGRKLLGGDGTRAQVQIRAHARARRVLSAIICKAMRNSPSVRYDVARGVARLLRKVKTQLGAIAVRHAFAVSQAVAQWRQDTRTMLRSCAPELIKTKRSRRTAHASTDK